MARRLTLFPLIVALFLATSVVALPAEKARPDGKKPIELADILDWKAIRSSVLSKDGQWFAYRLSPTEGNSEVVLRNTQSETEYRFPIGEASGGSFSPFGGASGSSSLAFSEDAKWAAFLIYPTKEEKKKLEKQKKKGFNKLGLVDLSGGERQVFEKVKAFSFSAENPDWIVMQRYPADDQGKGKEAWKGSDLILRRLDSGTQLNIGNVSEFSFNKSGRWLAWLVDAQGKAGNGIQARDMESGSVYALDSSKASYQRLNWTEDGDGFALLKGVEDEAYEDPLFSLLAFKDLSSVPFSRIVYDPSQDGSFPEGMTISSNRSPQWMKSLDAVVFGIEEVEKKEAKKEEGKQAGEEKEAEEQEAEGRPQPGEAKPDDDDKELPDLIIWHWKDDRLQSMQQVQENRDKNFSYLSIYRVDDHKFVRLADDDVRQVSVSPEHQWAIGLDNEKYMWKGNLDGRRYQDVYTIDLDTGQRRLAQERLRWYFGPSPDGSQFLYYEDGHYFTYDMAAGVSHKISENVPTSFVDEEDDHNIVKPPIRPMGWASDSNSVLLYDDWDVWNVSADGDQWVNLTRDGKQNGIRYQRRYRLDPDEDGIDLGKPLYWSAYGEWTKKAGVVRLAGDGSNQERLLWGDANFSLQKAEDAEIFLYTRQTYDQYPDYYVTDADLSDGRQVTDANPQQSEFLWSSGSRLIDYKSDKGDRLQAALFLPADYEEGQSYPTIVYIYEKLSQGLNRYYAPSANGFNKSVYTSQGYAVLMPDIVYRVNDPGRSAVWCVLPALKAAIETGVVDPQRVGLHGHSWGGYQTSFLVTQTEAFAAAVAGAPLTNMISMYSSIYWNTGSANQPIFESSQGRFTGGPWAVLDAYTRNSPVYYAENVKTPLIILHNDKDGAVDWNQGIEYFNTLRRLEKPVVMLQYKGENHGLRKPANRKDYTVRMKEFFDHYLKDAESPPWLSKGVAHLDHKEHLEERTPR